MTFDVSELNWWAVIVAAVASFMLGGLWYTVLFGKAWMRAYNFSEDDLKKMGEHPERVYPTFFLCDAATAFVVAVLAMNIGIESASGGAALGATLWVGVAGAAGLATHIGSGRPMTGWLIDTGKVFASLVLIGAIVGGWR